MVVALCGNNDIFLTNNLNSAVDKQENVQINQCLLEYGNRKS